MKHWTAPGWFFFFSLSVPHVLYCPVLQLQMGGHRQRQQSDVHAEALWVVAIDQLRPRHCRLRPGPHHQHGPVCRWVLSAAAVTSDIWYTPQSVVASLQSVWEIMKDNMIRYYYPVSQSNWVRSCEGKIIVISADNWSVVAVIFQEKLRQECLDISRFLICT